MGAIVGVGHGAFILVCAIPLLPYVHPHMASEHHGVTMSRQLEPPGFLAMNYGYQTPLMTVLAQAVYGGVLGAFVQIQHAMFPT
jgi:mitochondrial fission protein ELM1